MVVSSARPPFLPPLLLLEYALKTPTNRAKILSRASLAQSTDRRRYGTVDSTSTTLSGGTSFGFRRCPCSVASLSGNATQIASVKNPRASTPSADDPHCVVPAAGTSASSVVSTNQFFFFFLCFSTARTRDSVDVPLGHGLSLATGTALPAPFASTVA